jgi:hypothetical protein
VKPLAFMPALNKNLSVFQTSVFHINGLNESSIWEIGESYIARPQEKNLYGRGDILAAVIETAKLRVDYDNTPPRHANIIGWPKEKHEQKSLAQELAAEAKLKLRDSA